MQASPSQVFPYPTFERTAPATPHRQSESASCSYRDAARNGPTGRRSFMMVNFIATATMAIGLLATAPQAPHWEDSYGTALKETRAGSDPLLVVLDKPNSKKARIE